MGRQGAGQTDILESRSPFGGAWPCRRAGARQAEGDPMHDVVQIDLTDLLTQIPGQKRTRPTCSASRPSAAPRGDQAAASRRRSLEPLQRAIGKRVPLLRTSLLALGPLGFPPCPLFGSYLGRHLAQLLRDMARIIGRSRFTPMPTAL